MYLVKTSKVYIETPKPIYEKMTERVAKCTQITFEKQLSFSYFSIASYSPKKIFE